MPICPICQENNRDKNIFCINCGEELIAATGSVSSNRGPNVRSSGGVIKAVPSILVTPLKGASPDFPDPVRANSAQLPVFKNNSPDDAPPSPVSSSPIPTADAGSPFPDLQEDPAKPGTSVPDDGIPFPDEVDEGTTGSALPFPDMDSEPPPTEAVAPAFPDIGDSVAPEEAPMTFPEIDDDADLPENGSPAFPDIDETDAPQNDVSAFPDIDETDTPEEAVGFPEVDDEGDTGTSAAPAFPDIGGSEAPAPNAPAFPDIDDTDASSDHGIAFPDVDSETPAVSDKHQPDELNPFTDPFSNNTDSEMSSASATDMEAPFPDDGAPFDQSATPASVSATPFPDITTDDQSPEDKPLGDHSVAADRIASLPQLDELPPESQPIPKSPHGSQVTVAQAAVVTTIPAPAQWQGKECQMCGFQNEVDAVYCGECGTAFKKPATIAQAIKQFDLIELALDGSENCVHEINHNGVVANILTGEISPASGYNLQIHALFRRDGERVVLIPPKSNEGIFARIPSKKNVEIQSGSIFRVGSRTFRFEGRGRQRGAWGELRQILTEMPQNPIPLTQDETVFGREAGHILFSDDPLVSGTHMKLIRAAGIFYIHDMSSTNGTLLKIDRKYEPMIGQVFIVGQRIYRLASQ